MVVNKKVDRCGVGENIMMSSHKYRKFLRKNKFNENLLDGQLCCSELSGISTRVVRATPEVTSDEAAQMGDCRKLGSWSCWCLPGLFYQKTCQVSADECAEPGRERPGSHTMPGPQTSLTGKEHDPALSPTRGVTLVSFRL